MDPNLNNKHYLYQKSVQNAKKDLEFFKKQYRIEFNKIPTKFREDFCGTGLLCSEWIKSNVLNYAVGIDYDEETIKWGIENNLEGTDRVNLIVQNVLVEYNENENFHIICSLNYSHFLLNKRINLVKYFKNVKKNLTQGIFIIDFFGGSHIFTDHTHNNQNNNYKFISKGINIINNNVSASLNFKIEDKYYPHFNYNFRVYSLIELKEALEEAKFTNIKILIKQFNDEENDHFTDYTNIKFTDEYYSESERYGGYIISVVK